MVADGAAGRGPEEAVMPGIVACDPPTIAPLMQPLACAAGWNANVAAASAAAMNSVVFIIRDLLVIDTRPTRGAAAMFRVEAGSGWPCEGQCL
jgi:hypothetical protein